MNNTFIFCSRETANPSVEGYVKKEFKDKCATLFIKSESLFDELFQPYYSLPKEKLSEEDLRKIKETNEKIKNFKIELNEFCDEFLKKSKVFPFSLVGLEERLEILTIYSFKESLIYSETDERFYVNHFRFAKGILIRDIGLWKAFLEMMKTK